MYTGENYMLSVLRVIFKFVVKQNSKNKCLSEKDIGALNTALNTLDQLAISES